MTRDLKFGRRGRLKLLQDFGKSLVDVTANYAGLASTFDQVLKNLYVKAFAKADDIEL